MRKSIFAALLAASALGASAWPASAPDGAVRTPRGATAAPAVPSLKAKRAVEASAFPLPMLFKPTQSDFARCIPLDGNGDGKSWTFMTSEFISYGYSSTLDADEWLFIPFSTVDSENFMKLTVESCVQDGMYKESFEIAWGPEATPQAMTVVLDVDNITNKQWQSSECSFAMSGSGVNYLGIHANSVKDQYGLKLRNISLELQNTPVPLAPAIESSGLDNLNYSASVRLPSATLQGKPIEGAVGLSVAVDGTETADYPDCTPGDTKEIELSLTKGTHTVTYTAYVMADGMRSCSEPVLDVVRATDGAARTLPFFMAPTQDEFDADCFVLDANADSNSWTYSSEEEAMQYYYNSNPADDWVFLPVIDFGARGGAFEVSVDAKCASAYNAESFELCVGRTSNPADMTPMLSCSNIKNTIWDSYTGTITIGEGGRWYVGIHCTSAADQWSLYLANISINAAADNTPGTPLLKSTVFDGTEGVLTYTLPLLTADGRQLDTPVGLIVGVDGNETLRTEPAPAGSDVAVPLSLAIGHHTVTASAFTGEGENMLVGSPVVSRITASHPEGYVYPLPFAMRPTAGEFELLATADANGSGIVWDYNSGADNGKGAMVCRTTEGKSSDAWVFFPPVAITDASRIYKISAQVRAYLERFPEDFEICIGRSAAPEAMTVLLEQKGFNSYLYTEFAAEYIAPEAGSYVVGIHRKSDGEAHTLSVHSVGIADSGKSANAPAAPTGLSAVADPAGQLKATVSFTLPEVGIAGLPLDPDAVLTATVSSSAGATASATGRPGESLSVTVGGKEGVTEFEVSISSEADGTGESATVSTYCGFDRPGAPVVTGSSTGEDNMSMTISWTDSTSGANGGAVDRVTLRHNVYVALDDSGEYWNLLDELPAGVDSYTYNRSDALQDVVFLAVAAVNDKGMSLTSLAYQVLGVPYPLPMADDFGTGRYLYTPVITPTPTDEYCGNWFLDDPGLLIPALAGKNLKALFCVNTAEDDYKHGRLSLPKFSTVGSPAVELSLNLLAPGVCPAATVYAECHGSAPLAIGKIDKGEGFDGQTLRFALPEALLGKAWVNFYIELDFDGSSEAFILKSYSVREVFERQLQTSLLAPEEMGIGEEYSVTARVANLSETPQALPAVRCSLGDTLLEPADAASGELAPGATASFTYSIVPTADMAGRHTLRFELVDFTDQIPADNSAEREVAIVKGRHPVVLDLRGEHGADGLTLSWSTPEIKLSGNDEIEDYESFTYADEIGPWLNIDRDCGEVYGIGSTMPGEFVPKAFQVIDTSMLPAGVVPEAYSGSKYFMAITPESGAADDWLISPEVVGGSKVSFRLNILSEEYGAESVDLLYSTGGRTPEDFVLLQTFSQARIAWNPLEATLPADARYFAFHYRCEDIFGICLDDIFYSPLTDAEIAGYNVYRNGSKVADMHSLTEYVHRGSISAGDRFNVAVVTRTGSDTAEHPLSNTFIASTSGISGPTAAGRITGIEGAVIIEGCDGHAAAIHGTDGRSVAIRTALSGRERIALAPGVYLVEIDGAVTKVSVR